MSAPLVPLPPPLTDPLLDLPRSAPKQLKDALERGPSWVWAQFFLNQQQIQQQSARSISSASQTGQTASIGTTDLPIPALQAGLYRVSVYMRVTTADGVSSSLIVTIGSTDGAVPCSQSTPALVSNDVSKPQSATFLIRSDATTPISYATTYVSGGGGPAMAYDLEIVLESLGG